MRIGERLLRTPAAPLARIAHMATAWFASSLARAAIGLGTSLVIAHALGRDRFGVWTLCMTGASALTVAFDLGFGVLLTREAARGDCRVGPLLASALSVQLALFLPVGLFVFVGADGPWSGDVSPETMGAVAVIAGAGIAYGSLASVCRTSPRRLVAMLTVETMAAAAQCGGAALIVARGGAIPALLWLAAGVLIAQAMAAFGLWRLVAPDDRLVPPSLPSAGAALRRAFPFALTGLVANAQSRMAPLILGSLSDAGQVAFFSVAARLEGIVRRVPSAAFGAALPVLAHQVHCGQYESVRARFEGALRWFALAAGLLTAGAAPIVRLTYGPQFDGAVAPLMWAGLGLVPSLVNTGRKVFLYSVGREQIALRWSAVTVAIQAAACCALVPRFGATGAMCALALGECLVWWPLRSADVSVPPPVSVAPAPWVGSGL